MNRRGRGGNEGDGGNKENLYVPDCETEGDLVNNGGKQAKGVRR